MGLQICSSNVFKPNISLKILNYSIANSNNKFLQIKKVNGSWSEWSEWSACSNSCGGGMKHRSRKCNNPIPKNGGLECVGPLSEEQICNSFICFVRSAKFSWDMIILSKLQLN